MNTSPCQAPDQGGYTLIELMIANALTLVVALAILVLWYHAERELESLLTNLRLNQEMRLVAELLRDGGAQGGDGTWVEGLHFISTGELSPLDETTTLTTVAANTLTLGSNTLRLWKHRLVLVKGGSDPETLPTLSSSQTNAQVPCRGTSLPHPDCTGNALLTVEGLVTSVSVDPVTRSAAGQTAEVEVVLVDPLRAWDPNLTADRITETFRTTIALD